MQLTPERLTHVLRQHGQLPSETVKSIRELQRFDGYADVIVRLELCLTESAPCSVIAKVFGPAWYHISGQPELRFYRRLAPLTAGVPVPAFLGAIDDPAQSTALLLIEDLSDGYAPATLPLDPIWLDHLVDALIALHATWWGSPLLDSPEFLVPEQGIMCMPQALDESGLTLHLTAASQALDAFLMTHAPKLTVDEQALLCTLASEWSGQFRQRIADGRHLTLLHGDLHLFGNVFLSKAGPSGGVKLIDWSQTKRGLGPHDLMYLLLSVDAPNCVERDTLLLRRYHDGLLEAGVSSYTWEQCLWDYRFSMLTNVWLSVFQSSLKWLRKTLEAIQVWRSDDLLVLR